MAALSKMKLSDVTAIIIDDDRFAVTLLTQMLRGLGLETPTVVENGAAAQALLETNCYDLCICEAELTDMSGASLIKWIRRLQTPTRYMPIVVLTGHSFMKNVLTVRDSGANLVVKKPASPQILYDHIEWSAKHSRPFVETDNYVGPDRRFKSIGPPGGVGRRETDLSSEIGDAVEPNMSQSEIDAMVKPTKVFSV